LEEIRWKKSQNPGALGFLLGRLKLGWKERMREKFLGFGEIRKEMNG